MCYAHSGKMFVHLSDYKKTYTFFSFLQQNSAERLPQKNSMDYLQNTFSDWIIGRGLWLPRSPLLKPLDFFFYLCAYLEIQYIVKTITITTICNKAFRR